MNTFAVLCTDSYSAHHPAVLGLDDEILESQEWLKVVCDAARARAVVSATGAEHVWVAGSDSIDGINLAAALVRDGAPNVSLVTTQKSGSLHSRADAAGIGTVLDRAGFVREYSKAKSLVSQRCLPTPPSRIEREQRPFPAEEPVVEEAPAIVFPTKDRSGSTDASSRGAVISVVGAAGGVGKSTISVAVSYALAAEGKHVVLVDADLQCGDIHYLTGQDKALRIDSLLSAPRRIEGLSSSDGVPALIASPRSLEKSELVASALVSLVEALRDRFDFVIVNTGPAWDDLHMELLGTSDLVLFILDQRPTAIRLCRHVLDLCTRCGVATQPFVFLLNRCTKGSLFSSIDVSCALSGARSIELQDGGHTVEELLGCGQPIDLVQTRNAFLTSVKKTLLPLLGISVSSQRPMRSKHKWHVGPPHSQEPVCL